MTQAADDFALIKTAARVEDATRDSTAYVAAFNRLFTPRPLRELVAEGYADFRVDISEMLMFPLYTKWPVARIDMSRDRLFVFVELPFYAEARHEVILLEYCGDLPAIPILTPQDMGV